jgi:hypothetical protein
MYSTRRINSGVADNYISVNDPYDKKKVIDNSTRRYHGRQFQTQPSKGGQVEGYFAPFTYKPDTYQSYNTYLKTQPRAGRKLGFGSFDARRRDEFMLDIRAQQYKELLKQEYSYVNKFARDAAEKEGLGQSIPPPPPRYIEERDPSLPELFQTQVTKHLYDIGRGDTTPICNRCARETFYCPHRVGRGAQTLRRNGLVNIASEVYGSGIKSAIKPEHGRRSHIKDFFDRNHLHIYN